ncbi:MAG: VOC family protein [Chloroflexota bacterium]|nr:VOC family protein [Chloroflexota bacterium]
MVSISRLNHAVLYVRNVDASVAFYTGVLGFTVVQRMGTSAAFLRASGSKNHHDLGLFSVGDAAPQPARGSVGLYHLAWEVPSIEELASTRDTLAKAEALVGASDHGVSKSLYAKDPDGIEFEVMWAVPPEQWGELEHEATIEALDMEAELARHGGR